MGYRELLRALEEEVDRQIRERRAEASQECKRLLDTTRQELTAMREKVLDEERRRLEEKSARAISRARMELEHAILGEMRQQMAELQLEAEARLPAINDADVLTRLVDEVVSELGEGPVEFRVRVGQEDHLRSHLSRHHPELLPRVTIIGSPDVHGGVEVCLGGRQLLDNTLPSRLQNACQFLEPEIVAILFGEGHGGA
jgi:vacuolar-type H+-ATPase subunit E/Vma4